MLFRILFVIVESFNNRTASENVIVNSSFGRIKPDGSGVKVAVGAKASKRLNVLAFVFTSIGFPKSSNT